MWSKSDPVILKSFRILQSINELVVLYLGESVVLYLGQFLDVYHIKLISTQNRQNQMTLSGSRSYT